MASTVLMLMLLMVKKFRLLEALLILWIKMLGSLETVKHDQSSDGFKASGAEYI